MFQEGSAARASSPAGPAWRGPYVDRFDLFRLQADADKRCPNSAAFFARATIAGPIDDADAAYGRGDYPPSASSMKTMMSLISNTAISLRRSISLTHIALRLDHDMRPARIPADGGIDSPSSNKALASDRIDITCLPALEDAPWSPPGPARTICCKGLCRPA